MTPVRRRDEREEHSGRRRDLSLPPLPEPLPVEVVDNHVHLDIADGVLGEGDGEHATVAQLLAAMAEVNVTRAVQIGCDLPAARWTVECVEAHDQLLGGVAVHPNEAARLVAEAGPAALEAALEEIDGLLGHPLIRVVGETGLDHFRTGHDGRAAQERSFAAHIEMATRHGLALQIHDRDAHDDVVRVLHAQGAPDRTVFHCFSGGEELARTCMRHGWYASFAGVVTFRNAAPLREALRVLPRELLLVETDAPFLTPEPFRGRPNASYLVPHTVRAMADIRGEDLGELCEALRANSERVYGSWPESQAH